jgi:hypothetical protein
MRLTPTAQAVALSMAAHQPKEEDGAAIREFVAGHTDTPESQLLDLFRGVYVRQGKSDQWPQDEIKIKSIIEDETRRSKNQRRQEQREASRAIGDGRDSRTVLAAERVTLEDAIARFVFISDGRQVYDLEAHTPEPMAFADFEATYAGSKHHYNDSKGIPKIKSVAQVWLESTERMSAPAITYRPSAEVMTRSPKGEIAVNAWRPKERKAAPADWRERVAPFLAHISYLWGEDADIFFDWLAHVEQKPGELPHFGWIHVARAHGMGRNWVSCVLARVWGGNVAPAFDLVNTLETGFNGRLSRCHLAIVDEICEGGSLKWQHGSALRQLVTADQRLINPKYGRQRVEYNCCRWLLFSNHTGALPLDDNDRRFWVVEMQEPPRDPDYYANLYRLIHDRAFCDSVAAYLAQRDISKFNPGQRPPMNEAKSALIAMSKTDADFIAEEIVARWPVDVIFTTETSMLLDDQSLSTKAFAHSLDRAGIRRVSKAGGKLRGAEGSVTTAYIIRNHRDWSQADTHQLRAEQCRISPADKNRAMYGEKSVASINLC